MTTQAINSELPSFENPPVAEVVCGVLFDKLEKLTIPHFGGLWHCFPDYTGCREVMPLMPVLERFEGLPPTEEQELAEVPLPRVWFVHKDQNGIIQVQRDRFLHNWKKVKVDDQYPRYGYVKKLFHEHLATFENFLSERSLGTLTPRQYEMTYVNNIPRGQGWEELADLGQVFPDFAWNNRDDRFLDVPQGRHIRANFLVPDRTARLHASIRNAEQNGNPLVVFELTVRGISPDPSRDAMWRWFDMAREWIVRGFADLTGEEIQQKVWRRTQ